MNRAEGKAMIDRGLADLLVRQQRAARIGGAGSVAGQRRRRLTSWRCCGGSTSSIWRRRPADHGRRRCRAWPPVRSNGSGVQRLMKLIGLEALSPKPNSSRPSAQHWIYPYLLRGLASGRTECGLSTSPTSGWPPVARIFKP